MRFILHDKSSCLFPAYAGVIPTVELLTKIQLAFPRTRGGDPGCAVMVGCRRFFSPHTRG